MTRNGKWFTRGYSSCVNTKKVSQILQKKSYAQLVLFN